jgi:DNA polymerase family A
MTSQPHFASIIVVICGVVSVSGNLPKPMYIAALDFQTGAVSQIGMPKLEGQRNPPYPTGPQALIVTVQAEAMACVHVALGWRMPERVLDLVVEFRNLINGRTVPGGPTLVGALLWFDLPASSGVSIGNSPAEVCKRLQAVAVLFKRMERNIDWGRGLLRGRYLLAVGRIETTGIPVDFSSIRHLRSDWPRLRSRLIETVDAETNCFREGRLDPSAFAAWLFQQGIQWPRNANDTLELTADVFRERARTHPETRPIKDLRATLKGLCPNKFWVGNDGRNRVPQRPFASRTGRNQPSAKSTVLSGPKWMRFLVRPKPGMGLALIDWEQQEFGIAAALSGDKTMQASYRAGDAYLAFAVAAGAAPEGANRQTHSDVREQFKTCALGVQYGIGVDTLARLLNALRGTAQLLISRHKAIYPGFWRWSDNIESEGLLKGRLQSVFGWQVTVGADANPRFLRNFPMQANGAEMLRLACCTVTEAGIRVCAPLHDALLIEARLDDLDSTILETQRLMGEASAIVLDGYALRTDAHCARYPERLGDTRGQMIWSTFESVIKEQEQ